jgi:hypothetical protein
MFLLAAQHGLQAELLDDTLTRLGIRQRGILAECDAVVRLDFRIADHGTE